MISLKNFNFSDNSVGQYSSQYIECHWRCLTLLLRHESLTLQHSYKDYMNAAIDTLDVVSMSSVQYIVATIASISPKVRYIK